MRVIKNNSYSQSASVEVIVHKGQTIVLVSVISSGIYQMRRQMQYNNWSKHTDMAVISC